MVARLMAAHSMQPKHKNLLAPLAAINQVASSCKARLTLGHAGTSSSSSSSNANMQHTRQCDGVTL